MTFTGEVVERQFYLMFWEKYEEDCEREITKRSYEFSSKFESCQIRCEVLRQQDIVKLCNLINNPAYSHHEDGEFGVTMPVINN